MTTAQTYPAPSVELSDQLRAWRLTAALVDNDGGRFAAIVTETEDDGGQAVDALLAALTGSLVARLQMQLTPAKLARLLSDAQRACTENEIR